MWKLERGNLTGRSSSLVTVVNKAWFQNNSPYSTTHSGQLRMIGSGKAWLNEITIAKASGRYRDPRSGVVKNAHTPAYMPEKITDPYHPGGNSLCYLIQTAHLMGCDPIYAMGFTLKSGTGYHFGLTNPATRKRSFYSVEEPLIWLRWYQERYPNRVRLLPGWEGPVYDVFSTEESNDARPESDQDAEPLSTGHGPDTKAGATFAL